MPQRHKVAKIHEVKFKTKLANLKTLLRLEDK